MRRVAAPRVIAVLIVIAALAVACAHDEVTPPNASASEAEVLDVSVSGAEGAYLFAVTVRSQDTGCDGYVDWWEVVTPEGELLYRKTLLHSHVDEQPFTRSGGPVPAGASDEVIIRAHMNNSGYAGVARRGTVWTRFIKSTLKPGFGAELASRGPQPPRCTS